MTETKLSLKLDETDEIVEVDKLLSSRQISFSGYLLHSSETRRCYTNGELNKFVNSEDQVYLLDNRLYLKGRNNRSVKINAKLVDLNLLERVRINLKTVFSLFAGFLFYNKKPG